MDMDSAVAPARSFFWNLRGRRGCKHLAPTAPRDTFLATTKLRKERNVYRIVTSVWHKLRRSGKFISHWIALNT
jgi:hypothetical protein